MRKLNLAIAAIAALAISAVPAFATGVSVEDPTPTKTFTDAEGNRGYVEVSDDGAKACNENPALAGDSLTGYAYVSRSGQSFPDGSGEPSYGDEHIGAGDADGDDDSNTAPEGEPSNEGEPKPNDCPDPQGSVNPNP